jgi:tRNA(fMet)-specific endonuclease VapC
MILLDTSVCVQVLRESLGAARRSRPDIRFDGVVLSTIVLAELERGVMVDASRRPRFALDSLCVFARVVPFDEGAARSAGAIMADLQRRGTGIGFADSCIAAHALSLDIPLATLNTKHFARIPDLRLVGWKAS